MTKEEVIEFLDKCREWFEPYTAEKEKWNEVIDIVIKYLRKDLYCDHVGLVERVSGDHIITIEGNTKQGAR